MSEYSNFIKEYQKQNNLTYREAMKEVNGDYEKYKSTNNRTIDIIEDDKPPLDLQPMIKKKKIDIKKNTRKKNIKK